VTGVLVMAQAEIDRDRDAWLKARRELITGSEIAAVLGLSHWASPFSLYHAKIDGSGEADDKPAMARGRHLEPVIVDMFGAACPWLGLLDGGLYVNPARPWQAATFDRLAYDVQAADAEWFAEEIWSRAEQLPAGVVSWPVQIKTSATRDGWGDDGGDGIPLPYRAQALWEMETWGADHVTVPALFMTEWRLRIYHLRRDEAAQTDIDLMVAEAERFLHRVAEGDEPDIDWTPATTSTLRKLHPDLTDEEVQVPVSLARRYQRARAAEAAAKQRVKQAQNELRARMGSAARAVATGPAGELVKVCSRSISDSQVRAHVRHDDKLNPGRWGRNQEG
jgi:putative phage-type endonuclease